MYGAVTGLSWSRLGQLRGYPYALERIENVDASFDVSSLTLLLLESKRRSYLPRPFHLLGPIVNFDVVTGGEDAKRGDASSE
eukprot:11105763-Karenia_brevis.AAC.1